MRQQHALLVQARAEMFERAAKRYGCDVRNWLVRYRAGERDAVWREMGALGVLDDSTRADARRVADETMKRARVAIEELALRLASSGYVFVRPQKVFVPATPELHAEVDRLEATAGPIPLALRAFWEQVGAVDFVGEHPTWPLPAYLDLNSESRGTIRNVLRRLKRLVAPRGSRPAPSSVRTDPSHLLYADPLVVFGPEVSLQEYEDRTGDDDHDVDDAAFRIIVAPCALHKANVSGGTQEVDVAPVADPQLHGLYTQPETFVAYLRGAVRDAGFAGLRHRVDLAERAKLLAWGERLSRGLEPF